MNTLQRFERLEKEFFQGWVSRHPLLASGLGIHDSYDEKMPDGSVSAMQEDIRFLNRMLPEFRRIDPKGLPPPRRVDHALAVDTIRLWLFEREELRMWERIPEAPRAIGEGVFQLLSRNYAPLKLRLRLVMKRLAAMPAYIDVSRSRLRTPVKTLIEGELETITRLPGFFHLLKDVARNALPKTPFFELSNLVEEVHNALERYSDWLIVDVLSECGDDVPVGAGNFRRLLEMRGIPESPGALLAWGETEMARLREKLREAARKIKRKSMVEDVRDGIRQQHHDHFDGVMRFVRDSVHKARQFVVRSGFVPLPEGESLVVTETPSYLRHLLPLSGYWPPAKFEEKKEGFYFVTPGDCDSDRLKEHNYPALTNRTVHEAYPGRHLLASWQVRHPSLIRVFAQAPETQEGWAHYCEERVREMGHEETPAAQFMSVQDLLLRAARMVLDVKLHTGKISILKAVECLIDETGMDRVTCEAEIRRMICTPTHPMSFLYGKEKLKELKKWVRDRMKGRFEEAFFHAAVLQSGALPMYLLKKELEWRVEEELLRPPKPKAPPHGKAGSKKPGAKKSPAAAPVPKKAAPVPPSPRGPAARTLEPKRAPPLHTPAKRAARRPAPKGKRR